MLIHELNGTDGGFFKKSEIEFLGEEISFKFLTPKQLDQEIAVSIALYNKHFPPKQSGFDKFMRQAIPLTVIAGAVAISGGAVLAAYGMPVSTAVSVSATASTVSTSLATAGSAIASGASYVSGAGLVYSTVTGKTPPEKLMAAADLINSDSATNAMEKLAKREIGRQGVKLQDKDKRSNDALKERIRKEQQKLANKLRQQAVIESERSGLPMPEKRSVGGLEIAAVATPFLLYFLG